MKKNIFLTLTGFALIFSNQSFADILITPDSISYVTVPSQQIGGLNLDNPNNIINGNGLSGTPDINNWSTITHAAVSFDAPGNAWTTIDPGGPNSYFFESGGVPQVFEMTLTPDAANPFINSVIFWGYHFGVTNGNTLSEINLEFSSDGGNSFFDSRNGVSIPLTAEQAVRTMFAPVIGNTNFIRMTVTDNHFASNPEGGGGDRVGIAELRFTAVPEPSSALVLCALGLMTTLRRRR